MTHENCEPWGYVAPVVAANDVAALVRRATHLLNFTYSFRAVRPAYGRQSGIPKLTPSIHQYCVNGVGSLPISNLSMRKKKS